MNRTWSIVITSLLFVGAVVGQLSQSGGAAPANGPVVCDSSAALSMSSSSTVQAVALAAGKSVHVCAFAFNADGKAAVRMVQGTGSNCATGQSNLTPPFNLEANGSIGLGSGVGRLVKSNLGSAVCVANSTNKQVNALVVYTQF